MVCPCCLTSTGCNCCPRGKVPTEILCQLDLNITGHPLCCWVNQALTDGTGNRTVTVNRSFSQQVILQLTALNTPGGILNPGRLTCVTYLAVVATDDPWPLPGGAKATVSYRVRLDNANTASEVCRRDFLMELQFGCVSQCGLGCGSSELLVDNILQTFSHPADPVDGFCFVPFSATESGTRTVAAYPFCYDPDRPGQVTGFQEFSVDYEYSCEAIDWS